MKKPGNPALVREQIVRQLQAPHAFFQIIRRTVSL